jgi:hypothetical protein
MIKPSDTLMIIKNDLKAGIVKEVIYDGMKEYWIYSNPNAAKMNTQGQIVGKTEEIGEQKLKYIIMCENKPEHINCDHVNNIVISGIRFSNDDLGQDLSDYLLKTGRSI